MKKRILWIVPLALLLVCGVASAAASGLTGCSREDVEDALEAGMTPEEITAEYNSMCITLKSWDVYWEEIDACGYHPQRRELECAVKVKQRNGFGGIPALGPGSWEWILFCVDYPPLDGVFVPVNISAVHVHDEAFGIQPPWFYGVAVQADEFLHPEPVDGRTLDALAILSWTLVPDMDCDFVPTWGNQVNFKIKLDP